ncbi:MAG: hypothetical protein RBR97_17865 [Bacteroidales bacterium]|nr:hypothetical protein [Bacteroidales bacterium]
MSLTKKTLIIILFFSSITANAQFHIAYSTGYDFSTNRIEKLQKPASFYQFDAQNNGVPVYLSFGEGIYNAIKFGYKCEFMSFDISVGGNFNSLNFNGLDSKNSFYNSTIPTQTTFYDTLQLHPSYYPFFDEFLTFENETFYQYRYNLVNISPSVSFLLNAGSIDFNIKTGISFNFANIEFVTDYFSNTYSKTQSIEFWNKRTCELVLSRPEISWLVALGIDYHLSEKYSVFLNCGFKPLKFTPVKCKTIAIEAYNKENGVIIEEVNIVEQGDEEFIVPYPFEPVNYYFNTVSLTIGVRYFFNKN